MEQSDAQPFLWYRTSLSSWFHLEEDRVNQDELISSPEDDRWIFANADFDGDESIFHHPGEASGDEIQLKLTNYFFDLIE